MIGWVEETDCRKRLNSTLVLPGGLNLEAKEGADEDTR